MPERFPSSEGEDFLKEKYPDFPKSPEVESAVKRQEIRTGEKVKNEPKEKIGVYLDRLNEIFNPEDADKKERRVDILKDKLHDKFVLKEVPESYFKQQQRIAREQGHGDIEITNQLREEALKTISADQKQSLDAWIDYLGSSDATYPDWLKYWAFRSITGLSQYDKEAHEFKKRSKNTTSPFPDINREALAYVLDAVEKQQKEKAEKKGKKKTETTTEQQPTDEEWEKLLKTQNFGKLYGYAIEKITPASEEEKENIQGEWVKYDQGSNPKPLYESLQGHGTGWCTAGESVADTQLKAGDFYVFYSRDKQGLNKIPRVAIRMEGGEIAEVRGIEAEQNLEPIMTDIAKEKMATLQGGKKYEKRVTDMKKITEIEKRFISTKELEKKIADITQKDEVWDDSGVMLSPWKEEVEEIRKEIDAIKQQNESVVLDKDELIFLYEIDEKIEGFGYRADPRIGDILGQRDQKKDYGAIFECLPEEVAFNTGQLNNQTVVYVGNFERIGIDNGSYKNTHRKMLKGDDQRLQQMPASLKHIIGYIKLDETDIESLGQLVSIRGNAVFGESGRYGSSEHYSELKDLGQLEFVGGNLTLKGSKIESLGKLRAIKGDVNFANSDVKDLGDLETIGGSIEAFGREMKSLGKLKKVMGSIDFGYSQIEDLGQLESIGGLADFYQSEVRNLSQLKSIGGDLNMPTKVENLGQLQTVGGDIYLDNESTLDFSNVKYREIIKSPNK